MIGEKIAKKYMLDDKLLEDCVAYFYEKHSSIVTWISISTSKYMYLFISRIFCSVLPKNNCFMRNYITYDISF